MGEKPPTSSATKLKLAPVPMGMKTEEICSVYKGSAGRSLFYDDPEGGGIMMQEGGDPIWFHNDLGKGILLSLPSYKQLSLGSKQAFVNMTGLAINDLGKTFMNSQYAGAAYEIFWMEKLANELLPNFHAGTELAHFFQNYLPTAAPDLADAVERIPNGFQVSGFMVHGIKDKKYLSRAEAKRLDLSQVLPEILVSSPISVQFLQRGEIIFSGFVSPFSVHYIQAPDAKHHYLCAHPYLVLMATIRHLVLFRSASKDPEPEQPGLAAKLRSLLSPPPKPVPA